MCAKRYCMPAATVALTDEIISEHIESGSRVIDLGCGNGHLARKLMDAHGCSVLGIEVDVEQMQAAIGLGVAVVHADLDAGLPEIPNDSFDVAILSQTLQEVRHPKGVLEEICRIAAKTLVVVPNFGHWRVRWQVIQQGRAPVTEALPYEWYDTPNLHVMSMRDFRNLAQQVGFRIAKELPIIGDHAVDRAWAANLRAESAFYVLERIAKGT
jgi:methionine biosynthesis protein MetW